MLHLKKPRETRTLFTCFSEMLSDSIFAVLYVGCYKDSRDRVLPDYTNLGKQCTPANCVEHCKEKVSTSTLIHEIIQSKWTDFSVLVKMVHAGTISTPYISTNMK